MQRSNVYWQVLRMISVSLARPFWKLSEALVGQRQAFVGHANAACLAEGLCQRSVSEAIAFNLLALLVKVDVFGGRVYPDISILYAR